MSTPTAPATPAVGSHSEKSGSFRPDIQGLRALAVILVVLDHARIGPFHGGYIGVDVFFVISGFLITGLLLAESDRRGGVSLLDFYARRAKRILPAATLVLAVTVVAGYFLLSGIQAIRLFKDTVWATFFAANIKFARDETDYFAQDDAVPPIQHYWSLAVEEQFYLVWPLVVLLLVALFRSRGRARRAVVIAIAAISVVSFAWAWYAVGDNPRGAYFSTPARAWELGLGAATAAAALRLRRLSPRLLAAASWAGVAMIGVAAVSFTVDTRVPGVPALLPVLGAALLLGGGIATAGWGPQRFLSVLPMRWIGDRSYSFYLWHWPALVMVGEIWETPTGWSGLLVSLAALGLSDLSYRFVENPFRDRTFFRPRWRGIALYPVSVAALGVTVFAAHHLLVQDLNEKRPPITAEYCDRDGAPTCSDDPQVRLVQASVLAAQDDAEIPNPLRPAALGLADHVAADLGGCEYWGIPEPMPLCPRGDPDGDRTMVLLGDSHMRHWIPALERIAARNGFRSYSFVLQGCTPALVLPYSPFYEAPDRDCTFFHEWSQRQIERLRPDVVIMSTDTQARYVADGGTYVDDSQEIAAMIKAGMVERIESLEPLTERIVVLGDVPRLEFDPSVISDRGATLADGLSDPFRRSMLMRRAVKASTRATGIEYVETKQWFCAFDKCPVVVGDYITHRDRGHMTLEYAGSLSGALGRQLRLGDDVAVAAP
ncbi:MAG: acyltransferase [Actinomycetota bacterium]|nr:acyltransferase [Actinomycetota bacterium]